MLPPRLIKLRHDPMDEREEDFYQALYTQSQAQFNTYLQTGTVLNNYAHIFDILIRLRQAVDHPYLVIHSHSRTKTGTCVSCLMNIVSCLKNICLPSLPPFPGLIDSRTISDVLLSLSPSSPSPRIGSEGGTAGPAPVQDGAALDDDEEEECGLCHEGIENLVRAECGCGFCRLKTGGGKKGGREGGR